MDAKEFKEVIESIVDVKLNKKGITKYISAIVSSINQGDNTINVYLPPNDENIITGLLNKTGVNLSVGDSVELCTKNGKIKNAWVALRHGDNFIANNEYPSFSGDVNTLMKNGSYYATKCTNLPYNTAGYLVVMKHLNNANLVTQIFYRYTNNEVYIRNYNTNSPSGWKPWCSLNQGIYSTTEQVVGTWIDGKPIYRKVGSFTLSSVIPSDNTVGSIANIDTLVNLKATVNTDVNKIVLPISWNNTYDAGVMMQGNDIIIRSTWDIFSGAFGYYVIEYTKTTD